MRGALGLMLVGGGFLLAGLVLTGNLHIPGISSNNGSEPRPDPGNGGEPGGIRPKTTTPGSTSGGQAA